MTEKLTIKLFATLKDRAGARIITTPFPNPATVEALLTQVGEQIPALAPAMPTCLVAVNKTYADRDLTLNPTDEIAFFPPVSGGSDDGFPHPTYFAITPDPLDINHIHATLTQPDVGAIVTFTGAVRGQTNRHGLPAETIQLEYEAYNEMAVAKMGQIAHEIWQKWDNVKGVAIVQRIGTLGIGEVTTFVACASGHRDQGVFDAARYGIDRLKEIVPVWKKEVGKDKSVWVEGHYHPTAADN
jgi:molybdopterin synthase catalytic subunit